ncbi:MAG: hypothetical protein IJZ38_12775 [Bacteroides sp.]|nr:hypothetical protein [Bacteroides sp.]
MEACNEKNELTPDHYFAALKLIEQLHKDGLLPGYILRNILNDYKDSVDLSKFSITEGPGKEAAV